MHNFYKLVLFLCLGCAALSACGKLAAPSPYEGSGYPHTYPQN